MGWSGDNFGIVLKALASSIEPSRPAIVHGSRIVNWGELDTITDQIAAGLRAKGLKNGDVAGQMLRNTPDYLLAYFGCVKAGVTPVNVNYHYKERELSDIFARFELKALFVESDFAQSGRGAMPKDTLTFEIGSTDWDNLLSTSLPQEFAIHTDPNALFYTATGGTTGMPKAVMWPFDQAWQAFSISVWQRGPSQPAFVAASLEEHVAEATKIGPDHPASNSPMLLLSPLMHGAGQFTGVIQLLKGGTLAMLPSDKFDAKLTVEETKRLAVRSWFIVGNAFAMPLADVLEERDDAAVAVKSLLTVVSSGAIFSEDVKQRLIAQSPSLMVIDALGSSESSGTAMVVTTAAGSTGGGKFTAMPGRSTKLFDSDLTEIKPGDDGIGIVARSGPLPLGYLGEDEKNAATFPIIDGQRYLMTGDRARWSDDGGLDFIGRDNMCINTGGEKVFPEEVEEVLQAHKSVQDVRIVSVPDPRFGRKIVAVVQTVVAPDAPSSTRALQDALDGAARDALAGYKIPRIYVFTQQSLRLNNGKPDYKTAQLLADDWEG